MKKISFILVAIIFTMATSLSYGQKITTVCENSEKKKKISYAFINEYGSYMGGTVGLSGVFVGGVRFETGDMLGLGLGYETDFISRESVPLYVNYRHVFSSKKSLKPLLNFGIGTRISFWKDYIGVPYYGYIDIYTPPKQRCTFGLYGTIASGFKIKIFSFTSGFFLKSWNGEFFGGVEIKAGITF